VARDAIWTIVVVSSPLMSSALSSACGILVSGADSDPGTDPGVRAEILAIFVTLLLALPFMADALHSHMMRYRRESRRLMHDASIMRIDISLLPRSPPPSAGIRPHRRDGDAVAGW